MQWNKDTLRETRLKVGLSQTALAEALGVHFRTVQNWEKGATPIPTSVSLALDNLFGTTQGYVSREKYNKVLAVLEESLKETKKDLLTAICKWDDTVNKLHNAYCEIYKSTTI